MHDGDDGKCLYGLGASKVGGVQALRVLPDMLVTAGDDGTPLVFDYD